MTNIEHLQFADRTIDLGLASSALGLSVGPGVLMLRGSAANAGSVMTPMDMVTLSGHGSSIALRDNDLDPANPDDQTVITVDGLATLPSVLNLSGMTNSGVSLYWHDNASNNITGTQFSDRLIVMGGGNDVIYGGDGHDFIFLVRDGTGNKIVFGGAGSDHLESAVGNDRLIGGAGIDFLYGGAGNDRLIGGAGADYINGGEDIDTAVFSGALSEYTITSHGDEFTVTHIGGRQFDGTDTVMNVEFFQFKDQIVAAGDLLVL